MASERRVRRTGKDKDGDITSLCGDDGWSPRSKADAIQDIERQVYDYYVEEQSPRSYVKVVERNGGKKHLQTTSDTSSKNNLDNLPNC